MKAFFYLLILCCSIFHPLFSIYTPMRIGVRHIENKGIGYDKGYTTIEGFFAYDGARYVPFVDLRGHVFNDGRVAVNTGFGARALWNCFTYGINGYYDYRNTHKKKYHQAGAGVEFLGSVWEIRANGYLPFGSKEHTGHAQFSNFSGHLLFLKQRNQFAMKGFHVEAGGHIRKWESLDLFLGAGPYFFFKRNDGKDAIGAQARIYGRFKEYLSFQVSGSYDSVFHGIVQGEIGFYFPFGKRNCGCPCSNTERNLRDRLLQPVYRDEIIVVEKHDKKSVAIDPLTGDPFFFIFVNNTSHSDGTFESPYPFLSQAQANSSPHNIIYVFSGDGTSRNQNTGFTFQDFQKLWGSGTTQVLQTTLGAISIPPFTTNMPIITSSSNVVTLANNNEVSGFVVQTPSSNFAIGSSSLIENTIIQNNQINLSNSSIGIDLTLFTRTGLITNNTILGVDSGDRGINIQPANDTQMTCAIVSNKINNTGGNSIEFAGGGSSQDQLLVQNNTIQNGTNGFGVNVLMDGSNTILNLTSIGNTISGGLTGIVVVNNSNSESQVNATINQNVVTDYQLNGIRIVIVDGSCQAIELNNSVLGDGVSSAGITLENGTMASLGGQTLHAKINNNILKDNPANDVFVSNTSGGNLCLELLNNDSDDPGYFLENASGVFELETPSRTANTGPFDTDGVIEDVPPCTCGLCNGL